MSRWRDTRMPKNEIKQLRVRDIPNIGPAIEKGLIPLNLNEPAELIGKEPRRPSSNAPGIPRSLPRHGTHQGIPIPRPQRHNAMNFMGDGGPAGTRTW